MTATRTPEHASNPRSRDQETFYSVYRGKHTRLRYRSYLRLGKAHAARCLLDRAGISRRSQKVFDYGFGPGALFLVFEQDCALSGLELDPENVRAVKEMLVKKGYPLPRLDAVRPDAWEHHPLLDETHDLIILSHVLEHLDDPVRLLARLARCLGKHGRVLGLLPINEVVPDENHKWPCDSDTIASWASQSGLDIAAYLETDHVGYLIQPLLHANGRLGRIAAQGTGLGVGLLASLFSSEKWCDWSRALLAPLGAKPSQAVFLLRRP